LDIRNLNFVWSLAIGPWSFLISLPLPPPSVTIIIGSREGSVLRYFGTRILP
jgi:hypothetical protein